MCVQEPLFISRWKFYFNFALLIRSKFCTKGQTRRKYTNKILLNRKIDNFNVKYREYSLLA